MPDGLDIRPRGGCGGAGRWLLAALYCALLGCAGGGNFAPVVDQSGAPSRKIQTHVVSSGETLHSIAWRYGMDYRQLARANNIGPPYTIYPGQRLSLASPATATAGTTRPPSGAQPAPAPRSAPAPRADSSGGVARAPRSSPPRASAPPVSVPPPGRWHWPASGRVIRSFSPQSATNRGIDLHGELGQPVLAANDGTVVYAGSGLVGYGNLLIIKHGNEYLSAYGYNSRLLVREGDVVKGGQRVAEIGDTGTDSVKLHFEIRRNGRAVDPLGVLPPR